MKNRRQWLALAVAMSATAWVQAQSKTDEAVVKAPKIIEALDPKDVVLDRQGAAAPAAPRRDLAINLQVQFTFGSSDLLAQGKRQLDQLAMALNDRSLQAASFELAGHTDAVGDAESNLRLSLERANAVRSYLVQVHGLSASRLQTIGFGYARLAVPSKPEAAVNRRVEVRRLQAGAALPAAAAAPMPMGGRLVPTPQ